MIKYWSHHSHTLSILTINSMLAEAKAHNLGMPTHAYGIPPETGRQEMRFTVDTEQEADGRWTAKISGPVPVENVYGTTKGEATEKAREAALNAYKMAPAQTNFTEWGIIFENGTICSAVETPKKDPDGGVLITRTIASKSVVNPARLRDTEMICSICHRQFREHSFQEFGDCWKKIYGETSLRDAGWPPSPLGVRPQKG